MSQSSTPYNHGWAHIGLLMTMWIGLGLNPICGTLDSKYLWWNFADILEDLGMPYVIWEDEEFV